MYKIEMHQPSEAFYHCWRAAAAHIERQAQGPIAWLKARLEPPFLEHLSFRLGNQLFFVRVEDDHEVLQTPGSLTGLLRIADDCKGHPCIMPMRRPSEVWSPVDTGWGLRHARTGEPVDPVALITDELIEMTDWEVHDFAVMVVRQHLEEQGREITMSVGDPGLDPALWFKGDREPKWVVVRAVRHPNPEPAPPVKWAQIAQSCAHLSTMGHFVAVRSPAPMTLSIRKALAPCRFGAAIPWWSTSSAWYELIDRRECSKACCRDGDIELDTPAWCRGALLSWRAHCGYPYAGANATGAKPTLRK